MSEHFGFKPEQGKDINRNTTDSMDANVVSEELFYNLVTLNRWCAIRTAEDGDSLAKPLLLVVILVFRTTVIFINQDKATLFQRLINHFVKHPRPLTF